MEEIKKVEEVETKALTIVDQAKAVKVTNSETYIRAGVFWKSIGDMIKEVKATFDPICEAANKAHKTATAKRAQYLDPLEAAYKSVKKLISDYDADQERIRHVEEDRLRKIEEKKIEDQRIADALIAEKAGNKEAAQAIIDAPVYVPPVVLPKTTPKMEGGPVYRTIWKFRIMNAALIPREYLMPDEVKIGGVVRSLKAAVSIPGVEAYEERC